MSDNSDNHLEAETRARREDEMGRLRAHGAFNSRHRLARMLAFAAAQRRTDTTKKSKRKAAKASQRRNRGR